MTGQLLRNIQFDSRLIVLSGQFSNHFLEDLKILANQNEC